MKKIIAIISILFLLIGCTSVYAANQVNEAAQSTTGKIFDSIAGNTLVNGFINDSNGDKDEK